MLAITNVDLVIGLAVAVEAVSGFVFAEVVRLNFLTRWLRMPAQYRLAWILGLTTLTINVASLAATAVGGTQLTTPTSQLPLIAAVVVYPLMCLATWLVILVARSAGSTPR